MNKVIIKTYGTISLDYAIQCVASVSRNLEDRVGSYCVVKNPHSGIETVVDVVKNKSSITCRVCCVKEADLKNL